METKTNWTELKGKIKSKWDKFSDEEIESFKADLSLLTGKIEKVYGVAKEHADRQYDEFKKSVRSLINTGPVLVTSPQVQVIKPAQPAANTQNKLS